MSDHHVSMDDVLDAACIIYRVTSEQILSPRRLSRLVSVRRIIATAGRRFGFSSVDIGRALGLDHSSIHNLWRKKPEQAEVDLLMRFARGCAGKRLIDYAAALGITLPELDAQT